MRPVPPFACGSVLVTSVERSMSDVLMAPAVALRKPESEPMASELTFVAPAESEPVKRPPPATVSAEDGVVVPIPTFPPWKTAA